MYTYHDVHVSDSVGARCFSALGFFRGALFFLLVSALLTIAPTTSYAQVIDLTTLNAEETVGGVIFRQSNFDGSTGTGVFESFVRIQADPTEEGHNSSGRNLLNDENSSPSFTRDLPLSSVPLVTEMGTEYRQFRLDINQTASNPLLSMDELVVMTSATPGLLFGNIASFRAGGAVVFDLDDFPNGPVHLNYLLAPGSGNGDMVLQIPDDDFTCGATCYVYIWSAFGNEGGAYASNDGFEEWSVRRQGVLGVGKNAMPSFTRTYTWEITKGVEPAIWNLFTGDSGTSEYTVELNQMIVESDFAVTGEIVIENSTENRAFVFAVAENLPGATGLVVDCGVTFPHRLDGGEQLICSYSADLPDGALRTNEVVVTYGFGNSANQADDELFYEDATAPVDFTSVLPTVVGDETVNVTDSVEGDLGSFSGDGSTSYTRTFTCDGDEGEHDNIATIDETGQSDDATVTVNCYALEVSKTVETDWDRDWTWDIEKSAFTPQTEPDPLAGNSELNPLNLDAGQSYTVGYEVTVTASINSETSSVSGTIAVHNPAPIDAVLTDVSDLLSQAIAGDSSPTVDCGVAFPYTLVAGATLNCTYEQDPAMPENGTNTATATLQNYSYDKDEAATPAGTTDFDSNAETVAFTLDETDECVDVNDSNAANAIDPPGNPFPATSCATADGDSETFTYFIELVFADPEDCGPQVVPNTSDFETNDTATTGDASVTIYVDVFCPPDGCTLTPGYWKTHNETFHGGAPPDETWQQILDAAEGTTFFLSGQSYFEVLWTPPAGNAYYNLSFHYIAAELNMLNGASVPTEVGEAFDAATALFGTYTPAQIATLKGKNGNAVRAQFVSLAGILGAYNEGDGGVPHCDESNPEADLTAFLVNREEGPTVNAATSGENEAAAQDVATEAVKDSSTGAEEVSGAASIEAIPTEFGLAPSYPNPFRSSTTITFRLPEAASVTVRVYDLLGREVARVVDEALEAGTHQGVWNAADVASGTYIVHFSANSFVATQRITVMN